MIYDLDEANEKIGELEEQIENLQDRISTLENDREAVTKHRDDLLSAIQEAMPDLLEAVRVLERGRNA